MAEIITIAGRVEHDFDEHGLLEDVFIGENSLLSVLSHIRLTDGDTVEISIAIHRSNETERNG